MRRAVILWMLMAAATATAYGTEAAVWPRGGGWVWFQRCGWTPTGPTDPAQPKGSVRAAQGERREQIKIESRGHTFY